MPPNVGKQLKILSILYYIFIIYGTLLWGKRNDNYNYRSETNLILFSKKLLKYNKFDHINDLNKIYFFLEIVLNCFLFLPFSASIFFLIGKRISTSIQIFIIIFIVLGIETGQYIFNIGVFDIDDIVLNVLGGIIGIHIFNYFSKYN